MKKRLSLLLTALLLPLTLTAAPPVNDNKANATVVAGANVVINDNCAEATVESGDFAQKTMWWQWTAPASGRVTMDTVGSAALYLAVQVWLKETSGAVIGRVAYDDGEQFTSSYRPAVSFSVVQGTTYLIATGTVNTSATTALRLEIILDTNSVVGGMPFSQPVTMANDAFSQRITLTGNSAAGMAYNYSATTEAGEPAVSGIRTFWWTYTPTVTGRLSLSTVNGDAISKNLGIYIGTVVSGLKTLESQTTDYGNYNLSITIPVTAGTTYQISLGSYENTNSSGALILSLALDNNADVSGLNIPDAAVLTNDAFASRVALTGAQVSAIGYSRPASSEAGEPSAMGTKTIWWTYRPAADGRLNLTTDGSSAFSKNVGVYLGGNVSTLRDVAGQSTSYGTGNLAFSFPVTADTDYQIAVGSFNNSSGGSVVLTLTLDAAADVTDLNIPNPATIQNDAFAQRVPLTGKEVSAIGYTTSATNEIGEPAASGARSLWWTYTPPTAGRLIISTQGSDNFNKTVAVYLGSSLTGLRLVATVTNQNSSGTGNVVSFSLPVTANTSYQVSLGNINSNDAGDAAVISFSLDVDTDINDLNLPVPAAAANDLFASSTALTGAVVSGIGYATGAVREALEPAATKERTLWWSWTAPNNGLAMVDTTGSDASSGGSTIQRWVSVWIGGSLSGLSQVAVSARSTTPSVLFPITAGEVYRIAVGNDTNSAFPTSSVVMSIVSAPSSPVLAAPLVSKLVRLNEAVVLNATASGLGLAWQWTKNAAIISGASSATYAKTFASLNDAGVYAVAVAGPGGTSTSTSTANIGIVSGAATPVSVNEGGSMTITVSAAGPGLTYQWYRDGVIMLLGDARITGVNSATLSITGMTALDASVYHCAVSMPDALNPGVLTMNSGPFTVNGTFKPVTIGGGPYAWHVGRPVTDIIGTRFGATKLTITNLPKGVIYNNFNGQLSGSPEAAVTLGTFKATATNSLGTGPERSFAYSVIALDADAIGTFNGLVTNNSTWADTKFGGSLNVIVASSGYYTGSLKLGFTSLPLKGRFEDNGAGSITTTTVNLRKTLPALILTMQIDLSNGHLTGTLDETGHTTTVEAWRNVWSATNPAGTRATTYTAALAPPETLPGDTPDYPLGDGVSFVSITATGIVTWKGALADGTAITASTTMGPGGQIPLYLMLYNTATPTGSILGWNVVTLPVGADPLLDGSLYWQKENQTSSTASRAYKTGFTAHTLTVVGGKFVKPALNIIILGMTDKPGNARITFAEGGLTAPIISSTFRISKTNVPSLTGVTTPSKLTFTLNTTSVTNLGLFSGGFEIAEPAPSIIKRTVKYTGAVVNRLGTGTGHFLLPVLPGTSTAPQFSGWLELEAVN